MTKAYFNKLKKNIEKIINRNESFINNENFLPKVEEVKSALASDLDMEDSMIPIVIYFSLDPYKDKEIGESDEYKKLVAYTSKVVSKFESKLQ